MKERVGVVAIGRNEGERLRRCLTSVVERAGVVVYVDSGSTDDSVEMARGLGAMVVDLDRTTPFTAARARNAGLATLREAAPGLELVQFVDGDCEVAAGWLELAARQLDAEPQVAVVCGRRRERHPEASIYNRLCDIEWDTPVGYADACGGDALMRVAALAEVGGYDPDLIAGEEPDLCLRLRQRGWKVLRMDAEMTAARRGDDPVRPVVEALGPRRLRVRRRGRAPRGRAREALGQGGAEQLGVGRGGPDRGRGACPADDRG